MMTSREIVRRCIEFGDPSRIGLHFQVDPIQGKTWNESDFAGVAYATDPRFIPKPGQTEWMTEWGIRRSTINTGVGEAIGFPLAEGWHLLETYQLPDFAASWRYANLKSAVEKAHADGKYAYGNIPSIMLLPIDLRGMENWFVDNMLEQENLCCLLDKIVNLRDGIIAQYADAGVDGVITWDDMGTNGQVFVDPALFRKIYFPRYKHTIDTLHNRGMHFIHHCCGQVREYMEMFVEAGCDAIQLDQPELMGIEWLGRNYGGKICFWNCVDIQQTIGSGNLDAIDDEAHRQVWNLGNFGGGFMVKAYQQPESIGMTVAQAERQYQAFKRLAAYPLTPYR
ncbi:MAG: uroporphyrinogen decarboxylase family protein [Victivallales bacterium]